MSYEKNLGRLQGLIDTLLSFEKRPLTKIVLEDLRTTLNDLISDIKGQDTAKTTMDTKYAKLNDDGSDPDKDINWINKIKKENKLKHE